MSIKAKTNNPQSSTWFRKTVMGGSHKCCSVCRVMLVLAAVACSLRCAVWMGLATAGEPAAGAQLTLTPADDIQKALDAAAPGDTIVLKDGVYYQSLNITKGGTEGKPITLRAANGGAATLSGGPPPGVLDKLVFQPYEKDVYRAAVPWEVKRPVLADGLPLFRYNSLNEMLQRKGKQGGPEDSARWEGGFLYVRLEGGKNPGGARIDIGRQGADGNIRIKASDVTIEGLRLHMGITTALQGTGNRIVIRDCLASGAETGFSLNGDRNRLEYCEVSGPIRNEWRVKHYAGYEYGYGDAVKTSGSGDQRTVIRGNFIYHGFDGLQPRVSTSWVRTDWSEITGNLFMFNCDDAIELDTGAIHILNMRVHHNLFLNNFIAFSICAVEGGHLLVDHNIVYNSQDAFAWGAIFKLGTPWNPNVPAKDWAIVHNTLVNASGHGDFKWFGEKIVDHINVLFLNNIFYATNAIGDPGLKGAVWGNNLVCNPDATGKVPNSIGANLGNWDPFDARLQANSPAVDAGGSIPEPWAERLKGITPAYRHEARGKAPDLGALELGETWKFEQPGPRWGSWKDIPSRPAFPKSFDPSWAGFRKY